MSEITPHERLNKWAWGERRRERNADAGECVNQNLARTHGPRVSGFVRCAHCLAVHRKSAHTKKPTLAERAR